MAVSLHFHLPAATGTHHVRRALLVSALALALLPGCGSPEDEPWPGALRTLTPLQYEASLRTIFGDDVPSAQIGPRTTQLASASAGISERMLMAYEASALSVADWAFHVDTERRERLAGCTPLALAEDPCMRAVLARIGRLAFRRALDSAEVDRYAALAADLGQDDPWEGLTFAVSGLLQSPHFLYRQEFVDAKKTNTQRYASHTMATRLAFFLWNGPPDDALLRAAEQGQLETAEDTAAVVGLMLADPRAEAGRRSLLAELFHADLLAELQKDPTTFPDFDDELRDAMAEQLELTLNLAANEGSLASIFTTKTTFLNARLAELYGVDGDFGPELQAVTLPADSPRAGALTLPAILATRSYPGHTSVALRGLFVRKDLLCQDIPPPPPDVNPTLRTPSSGELVTTRELLAEHQTTPSCWGCHASMDPIGLALEKFDASGRFRDTQNGLPIDTGGDLDGVPFSDALGLGEALAAHPGVDSCFANNIYAYGVGRVVTVAEQKQLTAAIESKLSGRLALDEALRVIATSELFATMQVKTEQP